MLQLTRQNSMSSSSDHGRSNTIALLFSLVLHTTVLLILAVFGITKGTNSVTSDEPGIAVVLSEAPASDFFEDSFASSGGEAGNAGGQAVLASLPSASATGQAHASQLASLLPSTDSGGSGAATGNTGLGGGNSELSGGSGGYSKVKTSVFGIEGEGSRFIYVFDRSDSMNGSEGKPLTRAKNELINSLKSLGENHQFQIVFYNDKPLPFGGSQNAKMFRGDGESKELAIRFVRNTAGTGGTNHIDALNVAMAMNPDVIFFLTDADDNPGAQKLDRLVDKADRIGATIHCIQFGDGNRSIGSNWINQLAERTGGKYKYIDVSNF